MTAAIHKRWDVALKAIVNSAKMSTNIFLCQGDDKRWNHGDKSQCHEDLLQRFVQPTDEKDPTIQFLSSLCQLKQCHWTKCKRKDIKLKNVKDAEKHIVW